LSQAPMQLEPRGFPRLIISALRGGSGKTILSIGIIAAWIDLGKRVLPFKKGPDYIDAGWLALAAGRPCFNLDTFLISEEQILQSFISHASEGDVSVIEGNRGLFDGIDPEGSTSTAELAKLLSAPVVLCIDATKTTRTMAAVVSGCDRFDPAVRIRGVILNRVAGARHENILRSTIERYCGIPVIGAVPKLGNRNFPERHMGLVPTPEHAWAAESITAAADMARQYLDLEALAEIARGEDFNGPGKRAPATLSTAPRSIGPSPGADRPRIGVIRDSAFQFYYPENIESLTEAGAEVVFISPLKEASLSPVDALYIGGGFPETHAKALADNRRFRDAGKARAEEGMPIYAECGGLMYLGEELVLDETAYPMAGVLPIVYGFSRRPQGHGYTILEVDRENPFYPKGTRLRGHEFHYSRVMAFRGDSADLVFSMTRGKGLVDGRDGVVEKNVLATYSHIHALGTPFWAPGLVRQAADFRQKKKGGGHCR
jgi:cobyrinic acid a,c-diamide synthase